MLKFSKIFFVISIPVLLSCYLYLWSAEYREKERCKNYYVDSLCREYYYTLDPRMNGCYWAEKNIKKIMEDAAEDGFTHAEIGLFSREASERAAKRIKSEYKEL